jgi:hypothetical protein
MANKDTGIVNIHGKEYFTVAKRVGMFREQYKLDLSLSTELVSRDADCVVMKATITDQNGRVLATGHSEEYRQASQINRTSALENAETSAIGRALAALGLGGTEFASADEVANAIQQQGRITPADGAFNRCKPARRKVIADTAVQIRDYLAEDRDFDAFALCEDFTDPDEKVALWSFLDSKARARIKAQADAANKQEKAA